MEALPAPPPQRAVSVWNTRAWEAEGVALATVSQNHEDVSSRLYAMSLGARLGTPRFDRITRGVHAAASAVRTLAVPWKQWKRQVAGRRDANCAITCERRGWRRGSTITATPAHAGVEEWGSAAGCWEAGSGSDLAGAQRSSGRMATALRRNRIGQ